MLTRKATQKRLGETVGISQQAVSDLLARGILPAGGTLGEWLLAYCANLREQAAGRAAAGDLDLATERARLAKEQADRVAMENAQTRKELAPVLMMTMAIAKVAQQIVAILEGIPGVCKRRLGLSAEQVEVIQAEIVKARNVAAAIRLDVDALVTEASEHTNLR